MRPMPTYEYRCTSCERRFEVHQRIDEGPLTTCENCGGELRKVFHPAGIVFKGSGFYATDSRSKAKSKPETDSKSKASGGDSSSGGDAKPASSGESSKGDTQKPKKTAESGS